MSERLNPFLDGSEMELLELLREKLAPMQAQSVFMQNLLQADLENAGAFYEKAALRNFRLRNEFGIQEQLIQQEQLDDLLARRANGRNK